MRTRKPVGLVGIITDASRTLRVVTEGFHSRGSEQAVRPGDLWHVGSNTKAMTAVLYARLVEQGMASWEVTVEELFPGIPIHESWHKVTVEHLMSHTGGLDRRQTPGTSRVD